MAAPKKKKKARLGAAPPPGMFDPQLSAALEAAKRGFGDLQADFSRNFGADGKGGRAGNDYQLRLQQIALGRGQAHEDVGINYARMARQQGERQRQLGDLSSGLAAKSAAVRAANQGREDQRINTAYDLRQGDAGLQYGRSLEDAQTNLERAGRETNQFGVDTLQSEIFQATQAGWRPPKPPRKRRVKMQTYRPIAAPRVSGPLLAGF